MQRIVVSTMRPFSTLLCTTPTCLARLVIFTPQSTHTRSAPSTQRVLICSEGAATAATGMGGLRLDSVAELVAQLMMAQLFFHGSSEP